MSLHAHPESAFEEVNTAAFVAKKLEEMGIQVETGIGKTGVVGTLKVGDGERGGWLKSRYGLHLSSGGVGSALRLPEPGRHARLRT